MMWRAFSRYGFFGLSATALVACEGVPTLTFTEAGGGPDVNDSSIGASDASDAAQGFGCPDHPPDGATACCGVVACNGDCDARCAECENRCQQLGMQNSVCCVRNMVTCHMPGVPCN
jgi:hypothetical protein